MVDVTSTDIPMSPVWPGRRLAVPDPQWAAAALLWLAALAAGWRAFTVIGVLAVTVHSALDAAGLARRRGRSKSLSIRNAPETVIEADAPYVPVGIDGEAVILPTPARCTIRPDALRIRVPRHRPGVPAPRPELDWTRLRRLALSTGRV